MASPPPISVDIRDPSSSVLQSSIQDALVSKGWTEASDTVMAEYVLVMLANSKTKAQIDTELGDLIGPEYEAGFTTWLWGEARRIAGEGSKSGAAEAHPSSDSMVAGEGMDATQDVDLDARTESQERLDRDRRSSSRRSASPPPRNGAASGEGRYPRRGDHWEPKVKRNYGKDRYQPPKDRRGQQRQPRELFSSAVAQSNGATRNGRFRAQDAFDGSQAQSSSLEASVNAAGTQEVRIRGVAPSLADGTGKDLFNRSLNSAAMDNKRGIPIGPRAQHASTENAGRSLFSRAGIPDPRAAEFVPNGMSTIYLAPAATLSPSLSSRIDPMIPNNPPLDFSHESSSHSGEFPAEPSNSSLCRYATACTNPLCEYSHPSHQAAIAKRSGQISADPILTSSSACRFGLKCTNIECNFNHVSPAVYFIAQKQASTQRDASMLSGETTQIACRFADKCTNPSCAYAHFGADGKIVPSPALSRLVNPSAPTAVGNGPTQQPAEGQDDDIDIDIDVGSTSQADGQRGIDGKPLALDRPLGGSDGSNGSATADGVRPCKFGLACTRPGCWFSHPPGHSSHRNGGAVSQASTAPTPATATANGKLHISDRLSRFNRDGKAEGEMDAEADVERIIPESTV